MTDKQKRRRQLLKWRWEQHDDVSAKELAELLSCEALPWRAVPINLHAALVEFRHLRQDARVAACKAFLSG